MGRTCCGRRMASPGVYFYVAVVGRDGKKIKVDGFVHLFWPKIKEFDIAPLTEEIYLLIL